MKKSIILAAITSLVAFSMGACNKHSWDSTKDLYEEHGDAHGKGHDGGEHKEGEKHEEKH
jgi:hypothetical protein